MTQIRAIRVPGGIAIDGPNEDDEHDKERQLEIDELAELAAAKRAASGLSPEQHRLEDAFMKGKRAAALGHGAGMNEFPEGTAEHMEWERARLSLQGSGFNAPRCRYFKKNPCYCEGRFTCVEGC